MEAYVFVFIHLGTRTVFSSASAYHPDGPWIMQQARNASMWMEDQGIEPRFLIRDRDRKFPDEFDSFRKDQGARCIKISPRAPKANAFVETFIESLKRECLNFFLCFSRDQLDYIVQTWIDHYNTERPHRGSGMNNEVLDKRFQMESHGRVRCKKQLGGIIKPLLSRRRVDCEPDDFTERSCILICHPSTHHSKSSEDIAYAIGSPVAAMLN